MEQYHQLTVKIQKIKRAEQRLNVLLQNKSHLESDYNAKKIQLAAEEYDVEKLEGLSLHGFLHLIKGTLLDQLDKEEREAVMAKKAMEDAGEALSQCLKKIDETRHVLKDKLDIQRLYDKCIRSLEKDLVHSSDALQKLVQDQAYAKEVLREIREAQEAGAVLEDKLEGLYGQVKSIKTTVDIDESGLFKNASDHESVTEANKTLLYIQEDIHRFELELMDVFDVCDLLCDLSFLKDFSIFLVRGMMDRSSVSHKLNQFMVNTETVIEKLKNVMETLVDQKESIAFFVEKLNKEKQICIQTLLEANHEEAD